MNRRSFLQSASCRFHCRHPLRAARASGSSQNENYRVRLYAPPNATPLFNQSDLVVTIETDAGITGIGEGGSKEMLEQCAGRLIGRDPQHIEQLWQDMSRSFFYPPGREKEHALGSFGSGALWDLKGKVLSICRFMNLLGGAVRNYCECYNTAGHHSRS